MDTTDIHDSNQKLILAADDLKAVSSMILVVGDHTEYDNAYEALKVIDRALGPIIANIQTAVDAIEAALKRMEQNVQQD